MTMKRLLELSLALGAAVMLTAPALAQSTPTDPPAAAGAADKAEKTDQEKDKESALDSWKKGRPMTIQYLRPQDRRGLNVFETTKDPGAEFTGFRLDFGAAFTSQVQNLSHANTATPNMVSGVNANQLADIGFGFNNSTANLSLHTQLAPGVRVALTSYLSS